MPFRPVPRPRHRSVANVRSCIDRHLEPSGALTDLEIEHDADITSGREVGDLGAMFGAM